MSDSTTATASPVAVTVARRASSSRSERTFARTIDPTLTVVAARPSSAGSARFHAYLDGQLSRCSSACSAARRRGRTRSRRRNVADGTSLVPRRVYPGCQRYLSSTCLPEPYWPGPRGRADAGLERSTRRSRETFACAGELRTALPRRAARFATMWSVKTFLVVDDHPSFRKTARMLLESEGFEVVGEAADGASALEAVRPYVRTWSSSTSSSRTSTGSRSPRHLPRTDPRR